MKKLIITILMAAASSLLMAQTDSAEYARISAMLIGMGETSTAQKTVKAAECLIGRPYVGGTLDVPGNETLIVSMRQFDCVTFQETCLALARDAGSAKPSYANFRRQVENLRYRNGKIGGYHTRLHYSTDWILENTRRGNAVDATQRLGGVRMSGTLNYMSTHADKYKALSGNSAATDSIRAREKYLSAHHVYYIPKAKVAGIADRIEPGSLIFMTSATQSLGFGHVGIAVKEGGVLKMIHASSTAKKVMKTPGSLSDYLMGIPKITGIAVLEPK